MKFKRILSSCLIAAAAINLAACSRSSMNADGSEHYTINITCDASPKTVTGFCVTEFKRLVEERTDGKVTVYDYTDGAIGSDKEVMEHVRSGSIEMAAMNSGNQTTDIPAVNVFDMPCIFENAEVARAAWDEPAFRSLLNSKYEEAGLELLMLTDQGFRETSSNIPLQTIEDFKGLDIRTMTNDVHIQFWKALGANPTPMNRSEVFLALQQGLLDAQEDPYVSIELNNYAEVQDYICATNHQFHNITMIANKEFFDGLPQEYQELIRDVCEEILVSSRKMADEVAETSLQEMVNDGMEYVEPNQETHDWMTKVSEEKVWPIVREKAGNDIVDAMLEAAEKARE